MKMRPYRTLLITNAIILLLFVAAAFITERVVTVVSDRLQLSPSKVIIIDAGHGGEDGGATSCTGILESKINLEIALKLEDLMHLLGIRTVMIRTTDRSVYTQGQTLSEKKISDLKTRVNIANNTNNAIYVSIHQNHYPDTRYHGAQVFYAPTKGSSDIAECMQQALKQNLDMDNNRSIKKADGIYLMQHITCPGILIECGFLSNPEEEALLRDDQYQRKLCCVVASTCSQYLRRNDTLT